MFENMNPINRPTAFIEIIILILISFILGFIAARIPIPDKIFSKNSRESEKKPNSIDDDQYVDPRDIITEPTTIKAVLTRDRKGNYIAPIKNEDKKTVEKEDIPAPISRIAAIKKDYSKRALNTPNNSKNKETHKED